MKGLELLIRTVSKVKERYNPGLRLAGVLLGNYDRTAILDRQIHEMLKTRFGGETVFNTTIGRSVRMREATVHGKTIFEITDAASQAEQLNHLVRLVDDLMDVSRVMRGKIELRKETIELASIVARAVETVQSVIQMQDHQLSVNLPAESLLLGVDPMRLTQVIANLLTNAAKYTEPHGQIWLRAEREQDSVLLRIRDTGIGISPQMLTKVFDLFVQADHGASRSQGGLGIGLTLARNLVEMHGGTLTAKSEGLGRGSEFVVRLPLAAEKLIELDQDRESGPAKPSPSGYRLLVVDDNKDAANTFAMLLRLQGHDVQVAHDGLSALAAAQKYRPNLIFLDIGMPGMDGYEVARRLRLFPEQNKVVLAALTGWGQEKDRRQTSEAGFDFHLVKPPEPEALEALFAEVKRMKNEIGGS